MPQTLLMNDHIATVETEPGGDALWVPLESLEAATGWALEPEGACRGNACVPIPHGRAGEFVRADAFNIAAFARYLGQPVVHDEARGAWVIGEAATVRAATLQSVIAPDFTLPDLDSTEHSLHDHLGKKVVVVSWASW